MIYTITVAFCPAAQLARSLAKYYQVERRYYDPRSNHIIVQGHYPINKKKNNRDIEMICDAFEVKLLDPGKDLGSCQSQNWALEIINPEDDTYFINLDPDSHCDAVAWDEKMKSTLDTFDNCVLISCWSKMWEPYKNRLNITDNIGIAHQPIPFNLSMFRCSFIKEIGGLRQLGEKWGELEAPFHQSCVHHGKYHAYLMNCIEDESGKYMQDRQLLEYKDLYLRTDGPNKFTGTYEEFLKYKYPELLKMDSFIPDGTEFK